MVAGYSDLVVTKSTRKIMVLTTSDGRVSTYSQISFRTRSMPFIIAYFMKRESPTALGLGRRPEIERYLLLLP